MQAGTKESPQDFKQCLVGIRITDIASPNWLVSKSFTGTRRRMGVLGSKR